jgi:hypothetical protein
MRLDELIKEFRYALLLEDTDPEYPVKVILDGNEFSIDRVEPGPDGVLIILEA